MRKLLLLVAVLLPMFIVAQNEPKTEVAEVYVTGGGNHNRSCIGGTGRCTGDIITQSEKPSNVIVRKLSENQIEISIHKNDFSEKEFENVLQDMTFVIDENTRIAPSILRELKIDSNFGFIAIGSYDMRLEDDWFDIVLRLSEK